MVQKIADYDSQDYDYRAYWSGREYERWAEDRALRRLVALLGKPEWFVDFGGGFGRNAAHYRAAAGHYVIADHSVTNLTNAAELLADDLTAGRAALVRCDLNALPFVDAAFDAAMVVRVLHHLGDLDGALAEMGRTVGDRWLVDVPIKHHLLALLRGTARRDWRSVLGPDPVLTGTTAQPFWNFQLSAVRRCLHSRGWETRVMTSVNNLRRWDQALPRWLVRMLWPVARLAETVIQAAGRGWWGPSQFLIARRLTPVPARPRGGDAPGPGVPAVAARMACPACRGRLSWRPDAASCLGCSAVYPRMGAHWDFTVIPRRD